VKNYIKNYMKRMSSHIDGQLSGYFDIRIYPDMRETAGYVI